MGPRRRRAPLTGTVTLAVTLVVGCAGSPGPAGAGPGAGPGAAATAGGRPITGPSSTAPGGGAVSGPVCAGTPPPDRYAQVVWVVMENAPFGQVIGSPTAPTLDRLVAECGLVTNYHAVAHPSLPNYLALTSGSTHGVTDDGGPASHPISGPSLFGQLPGRWRALEEDMPGRCATDGSGEYAVKHNPAVYYRSLAVSCPAEDVPLRWPPDLSAAFTFITPDLCDDMHDCPLSTADRWLSRLLPYLTQSADYRAGRTVLFIVWDEAEGSAANLVPLVVVSRSVPPGRRCPLAATHYSLLRTTEQLLGLGYLGAASSASSLRGCLHI